MSGITDPRAWVNTTTGQSHCVPSAVAPTPWWPAPWAPGPSCPGWLTSASRRGKCRSPAPPYSGSCDRKNILCAVRCLLTLTHTLVLNIAARWKMRKCDGHRQKCWIQTKIFTWDQHLLNIIYKTSTRLALFKAFIEFACLFCITETVFQIRHLFRWHLSDLNWELWIFV